MAFTFLIDWDKDGEFTDLYDDVTARARTRLAPVQCEYGRDQSTALAPTTAGRGGFTLDNRSRDYSPRNSLSPLYGKVKPARPVYISRTVGANTYTIFRGHTDDSPINPDLENKTVTMGMVDNLADLRGQTISTSVYQSIRTGEAINVILDTWGWPTALRDLDPGATVIPFWWADNEDAFTAIERLVQSEGAPALVTLAPDGSITFRDRHHRLTRPRSINSQATFRAQESKLVAYMSTPFSYDDAWRNIVNQVITNIDVRGLQAEADVWTSEAKIVLGNLEELLITASTSDPFINAVTPVVDIDYELISGAATFLLFRASGSSATIKITAGAAGAVIEGLKLRAQPIAVSNSVQVRAEDVESVAQFGPRSLPYSLDWCDPTTADAVLEATVAARSQPLPILTATFVVPEQWPDICNQVLSLDLSDRVTVYEDETGLSATDFFIEHITHDFSDELDHRVTLGLEMCPTSNISPVFRFDTAGAGFNDGKFGSGVDDPASVFQFDNDTSGHRFDEGRFVT